MNEIFNKFLLTGDKFMSENHLKQLGFAYSNYGPFPKYQKFRKRILEFRI